jgi:F-type H+-transporting ATPase subunit beta
MLQPSIVSEVHYKTAQQVDKLYKKVQRITRNHCILGIDELSEEDRLTVGRARRRTFHHNLSLLQKFYWFN